MGTDQVNETRLLDVLDALLDGSLEPAGREELEAALLSSPRLRRCYWEYLQQHSLTRELLMESLGRGLAGRAAVAHPDRPRSAAARWLAGLAAAAAGLLAVGAFSLLRGPREAGHLILNSDGPGAGRAVVYGEALEAPDDEAVEVRLIDESTLRIEPMSRVVVTARRKVKLTSGRTRVLCRSDKTDPFVVTAGGTTVRAVGTEFVVIAERDISGSSDCAEEEDMRRAVSVVVLSGVVLVSNQFGQVRLAAGEAGVSRKGAKPARDKIAARVRELVRLLSSEKFSVRDKAKLELDKLLDDHEAVVLPLLEATLKSSKDIEVQTAITAILRRTLEGAVVVRELKKPSSDVLAPRDEAPVKVATLRPAVGSGIQPGINCSKGVVQLGVNKTGLPGRVRGRSGLLGFGNADSDAKPEMLFFGKDKVYAVKPDGQLAKGFPVTVPKGYQIAAVDDIDADGRIEIVCLGKNDVRVLSSNGKPVKVGFPVNFGGGVYKSLAVEDITGDGRKEILVSRWMQREVHAWNCKGKRLQGFPVRFPKWKDNVMNPLSFARSKKGNSSRQVLSMYTGEELALLDGKGKLQKGWPVSVAAAGMIFKFGGRVCGDITGDGVDEIFTLIGPKHGGHDWKLLALNAAGQPLPGFPREWSVVSARKAKFGGRDLARGLLMAFGDVDADGKNEAVYVDAAAYLHVVRADGTELQAESETDSPGKEVVERPGYPRYVRHGNSQAPLTTPMLWDFTGDGRKEIVYLVHGANGDGYTLQVFDRNGCDRAKELGLELTITGHLIQSTRLADMDKDGVPELVVFTKLDCRTVDAQGRPRFDRSKLWDRRVLAFSLRAKKKRKK
jgi:ferric-dicitrate binding protein FerR (iron transport regulator)